MHTVSQFVLEALIFYHASTIDSKYERNTTWNPQFGNKLHFGKTTLVYIDVIISSINDEYRAEVFMYT